MDTRRWISEFPGRSSEFALRGICAIVLIVLCSLLALGISAVGRPDHSPRLEGDETLAAHDTAGRIIRVMTYNIRYDNPDDGLFAWANRRNDLLSYVRLQHPDLLCIQEGLHRQVTFLNLGLPGFEYRGVGRDDGKEQGEYSAIFFNTHRFRCVKDGTFWLSPTPEIPGKAWDAALPRIVTWVQLRDSVSGKLLFVFNTHFDHQGVQARENSARLLRAKLSEIARTVPLILTGDFNADEKDSPHAILVSPDGNSTGLIDAFDASVIPHTGPRSTFSGFEGREDKEGNRIDWILVSHGVKVLNHATLLPRFATGYLSDHHPVIAEVELP
jgi:endonuclease/exonuclease/phosphatase family metal-dependent hydrolase